MDEHQKAVLEGVATLAKDDKLFAGLQEALMRNEELLESECDKRR